MIPEMHMSGLIYLSVESMAWVKWSWFICGSMAGAMIGFFIAKLFGMRVE